MALKFKTNASIAKLFVLLSVSILSAKSSEELETQNLYENRTVSGESAFLTKSGLSSVDIKNRTTLDYNEFGTCTKTDHTVPTNNRYKCCSTQPVVGWDYEVQTDTWSANDDFQVDIWDSDSLLASHYANSRCKVTNSNTLCTGVPCLYYEYDTKYDCKRSFQYVAASDASNKCIYITCQNSDSSSCSFSSIVAKFYVYEAPSPAPTPAPTPTPTPTPAPSITTTGDCKCTCCSGNSCSSSVVGYLNAGSSSSCTSNACRTTFPSTCPASGSSGSVMSTYSSSSTTTGSTGGFALSSGDKYSFVSESSSCPNFGACTNICRNGYQVTKNSDTSYVFKSTQTPSGPDCTVCFDIPVSGSSTATALTGSTTAQGTPVQFSITTPSSSSLLVTASVSGVGTCSWTYSKQSTSSSSSGVSALNGILALISTIFVAISLA